MSQQGPLLLVSAAARPALTAALDAAKVFPIVEVGWTEAAHAVGRIQPAAVLAMMAGADPADVATLTRHAASRKPYLPLIALDAEHDLPDNALPFAQGGETTSRLLARLRAALRIRTLHATVLRRLGERKAAETTLPDTDPLDDATVLLLGRGASYPA